MGEAKVNYKIKEPSLFSKALKRGASWPEREDLLDVVYWSRQILSVLIGILWGTIPLVGIFAIILYVGITTVLLSLYVTEYQKQDIEEYGGFTELAKEGFMSAFASFLVAWIITYSALHFT
uniref:Uncharacterized protein C20orf24 homolog n=1 Tax=Phallusia mammillata TaxID=59560 RepID=A0A6F9DQR7_9ASCI|nr:uncharacterized protein C20orf24 homolog [Phallusia mammillata]